MTDDDDAQQLGARLRRIGESALPPPLGTEDVLRAVEKAKGRRRVAAALGASGLVAGTVLLASIVVPQVAGDGDTQPTSVGTRGEMATDASAILATWVPSSIKGYRFPMSFDPMTAAISFDVNRWNGSDGCNGLGGTYRYDDDGSFTGQHGDQTEIGCANVPNADVVEQAALARIVGNTLSFSDADGGFLADYRRVEKLTTVPDVVGLTSVEAAEVLQGSGLAVRSCDDGYCAPVPVTGQTPAAGAEVPSGFDVELFGGDVAANARCPVDPLEPAVFGVDAELAGRGGLLCRYERGSGGRMEFSASALLTAAESTALRTAYDNRSRAMVKCALSREPVYSVVTYDRRHGSFATVTVDLSDCGTIHAAIPGASELEWLGGLATRHHVRLLNQLWTNS